VRRLALVLLIAAPACIAPSVLDEQARAVERAPAEVQWRAPTPADLDGLYESVSIEGEKAAQLWKIYYHFASDGTFSGAALLLGGAQPEFQTLSGTWKLDERGLDLGDGEPVRASAAPDQLKLESEGTLVILRRVAIS
jgi:hypothetical protein